MYYVRSDLRPSLCREKLKNNLDKQFIPAHEVCYPPWTSQLRTFAFALPLAWDIPLLGMAWSHSRKYPEAVSNLAVRPSLVSLFTISISLTFTISFVSTFYYTAYLLPLPLFLPPSLSLCLSAIQAPLGYEFLSVLLTGPPGARNSVWHREGGQIFTERMNTFLAVFLQWLMTLFSHINTENSFWFLQLGTRFPTS